MKKNILSICIIALSFMLFTFSASAAPVIGLTMPGLNVPYFASYIGAWDTATKEYGVETIVLDAQWDPAKQASQMEDLIASNVDVIVVVATDTQAIIPSLEKAFNAGIPIVASNAAPDESAYKFLACYAGPDDYQEGVIAAEMMAAALEGKGDVVILEGAPGTHPAVYRQKGFVETIEKIAPEIKVLASQPANWQKAMATSIMENWVLKYPNIDGVFGHDDTLAVGAADAAKAAGITDIVIIGIGGSGEGLAAVKSGDLYGTNLQSPVEDAKLAMEKAVAIANGEEIEDFFYYIPIPKVTMENVDQFEPEW